MFSLSNNNGRAALARYGVPALCAIGLVGATTIALLGIRAIYSIDDQSMIYLIPVLFSATRWGLVPALVAAVSAALACAYFLYEPAYSLYIADPDEVFDLVLFIIIAIATSPLAAAQKRQKEIAQQRETDMRGLYAFSRRLVGAQTASDIYGAIQDHLSKLISRRVILLGTAGGSPDYQEWLADASLPLAIRQKAVAIAAGQKASTAEPTLDENGRLWLVRTLSIRSPDLGVIAIQLGSSSEADAIRRRTDIVLADAATTLEHLDFGQAINETRIRAETNRLRDALISSVSHELRTPLASILGATTVLASAPSVTKEPRLHSLAIVAREEAERLNNDIQNLLDATRVTQQNLQPQRQWVDPADIVNAALGRRAQRLADRCILSDIAADLPLVNVDPTLIEQALSQLLDNAVKYSPAGSTIEVTARADQDRVVLSVRDEGAGLTADERARLWDRFFRGERHLSKVAGSGLGLWIAEAFVAANGGRLAAQSEGAECGTTVSITLPAIQVTVPERAHAFNE
jgi:two-component system, OmpR family, sensor histidine kinase KdpD